MDKISVCLNRGIIEIKVFVTLKTGSWNKDDQVNSLVTFKIFHLVLWILMFGSFFWGLEVLYFELIRCQYMRPYSDVFYEVDVVFLSLPLESYLFTLIIMIMRLLMFKPVPAFCLCFCLGSFLVPTVTERILLRIG